MLESIIDFYRKKIFIRPSTLLKGLGSLVFGYLASQVRFFDGSYPLGAAVCAALPSGVCGIMSALGAVAGLLLPVAQEDVMRKLSSIIIIVLLKILAEVAFSSLNIGHSAAWYAALGTTAGALFTIMSEGIYTEKLFCFIADIILSLGFAYFLSDIIGIYSRNHALQYLTAKEQVSLFAVCSMVFVCIDISVYSVSPARIFTLLLILYASYYGAEYSAIFAAFVSGTVVCIMYGRQEFFAVFAASAVTGCLVGSRSKPACLSSLFTACILGMTLNGSGGFAFCVLIETVIAGILFFITPKPLGVKLSAALEQRPLLARTDSLRRNMVSKMDFASEALKEVSKTVTTAAKRLSEINTPTLSAVFDQTREKVCKGCSFEVLCYGRAKSTTVNAFKQICADCRQYKSPVNIQPPKKWADRCIEPERVINILCIEYEKYANKMQAEKRLDEIRNAVSDQMDSLALTLSDMAFEFDTFEQFDVSRAGKIDSMLRRNSIKPVDVSCRINTNGRMSVDISIKKADLRTINKSDLIKRVSTACGRRFDMPCVNDTDNLAMISFYEKTVYEIEYGAAQHCCNNSKLCGDSYIAFNDGRGGFVAILSDGMGSGGRACVDSSMAAGLMQRLILAGFGFDCALKLVNSAMLFKSSDESLATLDITRIDLYTGDVKFYKAGACETTLIHSNKSIKAFCRNLPAGILRTVSFEVTEKQIANGDIIVMVSDGAVYGNSLAIEDLAVDHQNENAQKMSDIILQSIASGRNDGHDDDVTVIVLKCKYS